MRPITHWIDGEPVAANGAPVGEVFNPATGKISGLVPLASDDQVDLAVSAGIRAFPQMERHVARPTLRSDVQFSRLSVRSDG